MAVDWFRTYRFLKRYGPYFTANLQRTREAMAYFVSATKKEAYRDSEAAYYAKEIDEFIERFKVLSEKNPKENKIKDKE